MKHFAKAHDFPFPYLRDETQTVARAYGAVCTPDFFGYNADRKLKYRGRLDEGRATPPRAGAHRELVEAMRAIANTGVAPAESRGVHWLLDQMEGRINRALVAAPTSYAVWRRSRKHGAYSPKGLLGISLALGDLKGAVAMAAR